jgi:hypothetical protein
MAGANAHQKVSDKVYEDLINKTKTHLVVQVSDYYTRKLRGKKYIIIENDEKPEKQGARFLIQSIVELSGRVVEDIYGQSIGGPYLSISLKLRQKTK